MFGAVVLGVLIVIFGLTIGLVIWAVCSARVRTDAARGAWWLAALNDPRPKFFVTGVRQHARTGTKGWIRRVPGVEAVPTWVEGSRLQPGDLIVLAHEPRVGYGTHHGEYGVRYIDDGQVAVHLPAGWGQSCARWQERERRRQSAQVRTRG